MQRTIEIQQTLHGYRDGHELLGASVDLSREARRQLLAFSDLAGDVMVRGFERYISAYLLEGSEFFAFACTWYAPEMERPGCVWTHTLLINQRMLGDISLDALSGHFQRPSEHLRVSAYREAIALDRKSSVLVRAYAGPEAEAALRTLYVPWVPPLLLSAHESSTFEELLLALWDQAPSGARQDISFTTGGLDIRAWGSRPLRIQVVPAERAAKLQRRLNGMVTPGQVAKSATEVVDSEGVSLLAQDLRDPDIRFSGHHSRSSRKTRRSHG